MDRPLTNPNDQAFPEGATMGLTKREYFAAQALLALIRPSDIGGERLGAEAADYAVYYADRLIKALNLGVLPSE